MSGAMNFHNALQRQPSHESVDPISLPQASQRHPSSTTMRPTYTPSDSRISVVLQSPSRPQDYLSPMMPSDERIASDLSKKFKQVASTSSIKQTPVPLPARPGTGEPSKHLVGVHTSRSHHTVPTQAPRPIIKETPVPIPQPPTINRVGRPKGWRPGMSYAAMRGNGVPSSAPSRASSSAQANGNGIVKRRGRPPKQASPSPRVLYLRLEPKFLVFGCEWGDCKAELQNLDTLRRHVEKVHVQQVQDGFCRWGKCRAMDRKFDHGSRLPAHVEEKHLIPFGWHVGDGPKNKLQIPKKKRMKKEGDEERMKPRTREDEYDDDETADTEEEEEEEKEKDELPSYLKDKHGHQVTPSIKDQKVEDYLTWRENRKRLRRLLLERDKNLPDAESDAESQS